MFIPIFMAILLGLINPSHTNNNCNGGGAVYVTTTNSDPNDPGDGGEDDGEDDGNDGPGTGGGTGNIPPPKP